MKTQKIIAASAAFIMLASSVRGIAAETEQTGTVYTYQAAYESDAVVTVETAELSENELSDTVTVEFSAAEGRGEYNIILKPEAGKKIDFMAASLAFVNRCATVDYEILPGSGISVTEASSSTDNEIETREYVFEADAAVEAADAGITLGTVKFCGGGTLDFSVNSGYTMPGRTPNTVKTAVSGSAAEYYTLDGTRRLNAAAGITGLLEKQTKDLVVNIEFPNSVNVDNISAFQSMTLTIDGGDLLSPIRAALGNDAALPDGVSIVSRQAGENTAEAYILTFDDLLTADYLYNVKVEGAGYRTARYSVLMNTDKELTFWNNVTLDANKKAIENGVDADSKKMSENFLAGDIVRNNEIDIYDLSAVISYFGSSSDRQSAWNYISYDLNRDGAIDSKDIAYVLVSWGR